MRVKIINFEDMSDSKELLDAGSPKVLIAFVYTCILFLIIGFIWMWIFEIDIVLKSSGMIRPENNISIIRNTTSGIVKNCSFKQGQYVNAGDILYIIDSGEYDLKKESLTNIIIKKRNEYNNNITLLESIKLNKNMFTKNNTDFYNQFKVYSFNLEKLKIDYQRAQKEYDLKNILSKQFVARTELDKLESAAYYSKLNYLEYQANSISEISHKIKQLDDTLSNLSDQEQSLDEKIKRCIITSPISGKIQIIERFNKYDYLPGGIEVMRIIPQENNAKRVEILVQNKDILRIELGDKVQLNFFAKPSDSLITVNGTINEIPADITVNDQLDNSIYIIGASIIRNDKQIDSLLKTGMLCQARIIISSKKILYYMLEKLNFINKVEKI